MEKKKSSIIWGVVLILIGLNIASSTLFHFNMFNIFRGWWTLFIIIPCAKDAMEKGFKPGNIWGLGIGCALFLSAQFSGIGGIVWKLFVPVMLLATGMNMIKRNSGDGEEKKRSHVHMGLGLNDYVGIFSGQKINYPPQKFEGCTANAVFGGVDIDLRNAIIEEDIIIEASAIFGGIDLMVPPNVRVKVSCVPIFGVVKNKTKEPEDINAPTIFLNATCMFGGVDIK